MNDEKMLMAIKEKDEKVMSFVIQKYSKMLWKIVANVLINSSGAAEVEECVADVFIHLWMNPGKFNPDKGKLSSYLSMVARNKAIDRYRYLSKRQEVLLEENIVGQSEVLLGIISKEEKQKLLNCIKKLTQTDRDIIVRRNFYNQKPKDIAIVMELSGKQVENRLYKAKQQLRKMLKEGE